MKSSERIGQVLGQVVAPAFAAVSGARGARTFHPRGDLAFAHVRPAEQSALPDLARVLVGPAFVRFSSALWKSPRWPDVLGCALGFTRKGRSLKADQHLLFATIRRPWTMPFAPFTTAVGDYLANTYFGVSPFHAPGAERVYLKLAPQRARETAEWNSAPRQQRLAHDIESGHARLSLEAAPGPRGPWLPVVVIELFALAGEDPTDLRLDPFLDSRGVVPYGFVHALRHGAYAGSQAGRSHAASH